MSGSVWTFRLPASSRVTWRRKWPVMAGSVRCRRVLGIYVRIGSRAIAWTPRQPA